MPTFINMTTVFPCSPLRGSPHPDADARLRAMSQNLRSQVLRQALRLFPRATVIGSANGHRPHPLRGMSRKVRERRAPSAPTAPGSPAQPWSVMLTMVARAMKTPRCHGGCEREEQPPRQRPLRCGCRHLNASLLLYPALLTEPASGREAEHVRFTTGRFRAKAPCGTPRCGVLVYCPLSGACPPSLERATEDRRTPCGTRTASTLDAGLCAGSSRDPPSAACSGLRGVEHPASHAGKLDLLLSSAASPHVLSSSSKSGPTGFAALRRVRQGRPTSRLRRPSVTPTCLPSRSLRRRLVTP